MSLTEVTPELVNKAQVGKIKNAEFVEVIAKSLPEAWDIYTKLAEQLAIDAAKPAIFAPLHLDDEIRGQLLRTRASDSMRRALDNHFGFKFGFQNCHTLGAFSLPTHRREYRRFTSPAAQIVNQSPELRDC
mgnify:CR=1 FL=1